MLLIPLLAGLVGCSSSPDTAQGDEPNAEASTPDIKNDDSWYVETWNAIHSTSGSAWDGTKTYTVKSAKAVKEWTKQSYEWQKDNQFTLRRLAEGKYHSFVNEPEMLAQLEKITSECKLTCSSSDAGIELESARDAMQQGDLRVAVERYHRWQESWVRGESAVPEIAEIKESLLASTALFAEQYFQARASINGLSEEEKSVEVGRLVISCFQEGVLNALKKQPLNSDLSALSEMMGKLEDGFNTNLEFKNEVVNELKKMSKVQRFAFNPVFWNMVILVAERRQDYDVARQYYHGFSEEIINIFNSNFISSVLSKKFLLQLQYLLSRKQLSNKVLTQILDDKLLSAKDHAELEAFRIKYELLFDHWIHLLCLYYVDLPMRTQIMSASAKIDRAMGTFNDDEDGIMAAAQDLKTIPGLLIFYRDTSTNELYTELIIRIKDELSKSQYEEVKSKARTAPEWQKSLDLEDLVKATGSR